jgi:hypothetical protein
MTDDYLLLAVEALTKPTIEHYKQTDDDGRYIKTHTTEHPPLLEQLRERVNPSTNTSAGSASLKSNRNLIDSDALYRYSQISSQIGDWCLMVKAPRTHDPIANLNRWYAAYSGDPAWYEKQLKAWAAAIRKMIDRPEQITITTPCPVCKSRTWIDGDGETMPFPIIVEYRKPEGDEPITPRATCRAVECGTTWEGFGSLEELGEELNDTPAESVITPL